LPSCHLTLAALRPRISKYALAIKRYPQRPQTIGDHLRRRRLDLGLEQMDVAKTLRVHRASVQNWENNLYEPTAHMCAKIHAFLGYDPRAGTKKMSQLNRKAIK
jgi:DNA-binding XRE family transcriptional regulator